MNHIFLLLLLCVGFDRVYCQQPVGDRLLPPLSYGFNGYLGDRFTASYDLHILGQDVDHLISPFRNRIETRRWQSEFWGKWFTSATLAYRYRPTEELKVKLNDAVAALLATQTPDGYIGNYADSARLQHWDIWGRKYTMLGLLEHYALTNETNSLQAACRVADHLMRELETQGGKIVVKGNYRGMAASSVLEPVCQLYNYTGDKRYLDFAEEIVRQWETTEGPKLISKARQDVASRFPKPAQGWYNWEQGQKAYEMMSCYEGLLELFRITGKEGYLQAVEAVWENIRTTEINVAGSGASAEMWFGGTSRQTLPVYHYQETCVTVTWIKLSHQLLRLTGAAKYADAVERTFYNALLGSLGPREYRWAKYTPLVGQRLPGSGQCGMDLNCCDASGPRGLFNVPAHTVMANHKGITVNYYIPGEYVASVHGNAVKVTQETSYPETGIVSMRIGLESPKTFAVSLRIPAWSANTSLTVNGESVSVDRMGFVQVDRDWKDGDVIDIAIDVRGRVERQGQHVAIMRGPVLLARDSPLEGPGMLATLQPVLDSDGFLELTPILTKSRHTWMEFSARFIPESYKETSADPVVVHLCDYATAGYLPDSEGFRVWHPVLFDPRRNNSKDHGYQ